MIRPISISLSPNTERDDIWLAFGLLFEPWKWVRGKATKKLEKKFTERLGVKHAFAFNSGRSAFLAILESLGLEKGSEVLLQAFTCNAVPNPVLWAGLRPVYVDCNEDDFNIDVADLEKKVTLRQAQGRLPRVVIVQHTFGLPADIDSVLEVCKKHNLILIEDCAHALGAKYKGREVGTFGKAAFFSFSRDKVISSVYGGMVTTGDDALVKRVKEFQEKSGYPSAPWIVQQLWHPVYLNWKILPVYGVVGKYLLVLAQQLRLVSKAVHWKEKRGMKPAYFPKRMPNALAVLALRQLEKLDRFNDHRKQIAKKYFTTLDDFGFGLPKEFLGRENIFLRFAVKHPKAHEITKKAWKQNLLLGDWYTNPLAPSDTQLEKLGYEKGSCPKAEKLTDITLNLPTHINIKEKEFRRIVLFLKQHASKT